VTEQPPAYLQEYPGLTIFEGDVLRIEHDWGADYDVQNGGWSSDGPNSPDTWLSEHVLVRFHGKRVRVTIEELGDSLRHPMESTVTN
jgi:hypothetical protein